MNPVRLNIDDMTTMHITIGHGPEGWIVDESALGHGSMLVAVNPDHISVIVRGMVTRYMERARALIGDDVQLDRYVANLGAQPMPHPGTDDAKTMLSSEIKAAFAAIPDATRKAAASLPAALAEVERWKLHHAQQVDDNRRLRADLAAHKRALAAGPAALRRFGFDGYELAAFDVEAAQAAAMREGT